MSAITVAPVRLSLPAIPQATHAARIAALIERGAAEGIDAFAVYGDREHAANIAFLSGYDPRFEEALLIIVPGRTPDLLVGNEGWSYAEFCGGPYRRVLYQTFSLMAQPRDRSRALPDLLRDAGLTSGMHIGAIGWKSFGAGDHGLGAAALDIPAWLAEALRALAGPGGSVSNAASILMNPADGLRATNDIDQLAAFEAAATFTSQGLRAVLARVEPGMSELDAARLMGMSGLPLSCHPMFASGERARFGLPSPGFRLLRRGDPVSMAYGLQGGLTARAGFLVEAAGELPAPIRDYVERLVGPYFAAAVAWYETIGIGVAGGALWDAVMSRIGAPFFGVGLNPGHLIHLDEWLHSPIHAGSTLPIRSGMALQVDIIPATGTAYVTTNIEDGIAILDEAGREAFAERYPEAWERIEARRAFMTGALGVRLKPEVLPFSNIPAFLPPFWLARDTAMAVVGR